MTASRRAGGFFLLLALALSPVAARDFKVKPGELPDLRPGEGLLVVAVDSDLPVTSLAVTSQSSAFTGGKMTDIGVGQTLGLYVMPAGQYRWDRLRRGWLQWTLREEEEFRFEVKSGRISYAGDLVFRNAYRFHVANRGLQTLDWLEAQHPALLRRHGFEYLGHYPDPFPDFYREQLQSLGSPAPKDRDRKLEPPAPGTLPMAVKELWKPYRLLSQAISPDGRFVAGALREEGLNWAIDLYDLKVGSIRRLAKSRTRIGDLDWKDKDTLLAEIEDDFGPPRLWIFRFDADGKQAMLVVPRPGIMVDQLVADPGHILFASHGTHGETQVHRLDIRSEAALRDFRFPLSQRLNRGLEHDYQWFTDARGEIRAAMIQRDEKAVLVHGGDGRFQDVLVLDDPEHFTPLAMSADGELIYGLSESARQQRELVEFDPRRKAITRTLFAKPGIDVVTPLLDERGDLAGVAYYEAGQMVSEYFDTERQNLTGTLARTFPGRTVALLARDRSGRQNLLWVDGSDQPPLAYHLDLDAGRASVLDSAAPWLDGKRFAPAQTLKVRSSDGLELEAYLTLPVAPAGKHPLVVMPHGGPIGVADRRHFDPEVQFLASLGYAVLQVNFRGSEGYGRAFREAGHRSLGTLIEDDIDAAITGALARFPLDGKRMCMLGSSYGGYSSLMSAVRWPDRFRCVVSIAGISDRSLMFTASDGGRTADGRAMLEKLFGDPRTEQVLMRETSPLFQFRKLQVPVMLVHGGEDWRVDYEHTRRLLRMLSLAGRPPVVMFFPKERHGIKNADNQEKTWQGIAGFLRQHLGPAGAVPEAPKAGVGAR